ncbi:uncharacterized protein LOC126709654 [Quercus robur]|uniref:uncharacterized protein LOC126709654 n=1 Tax=Quercus robur TaxID=38942 RepID=UPI002161504B|nr:uncharacterized protein LOC126709654 [Quercus robur]
MASIEFDDDKKVRKSVVIQRRPLMMLKDYLRDDLSSCSSNGFKSFPRRQCCSSTTVRFLLELDLKLRDHSSTTKITAKQRLFRLRSRSLRSKLTATPPASTTTISAFQRASEAVINAVKKQLPFHSVNSPSSIKTRKGHFLSRSLSRKLFRRSFWNWKRADKEEEEKEGSDIGRWRLFSEFLNEKDEPSDIAATTTTSSNSWEESEFTAEILRSSSGNSNSESVSTSNDVVQGKNDLPVKKTERVGVTVGEDSMFGATNTYSGTNTKEWTNKQKEQFSPVSVLDSPFEDDEDIGSPFESSLACIEGTKQKFMHKIRRFECLAQLEPVDLEERIAFCELNHESPQSPMQPCPLSTQDNNMFNKKEENQTEQLIKAQELLDLIRTKSSPSGSKFKVDSLLLDFIEEKIEENNVNASTTTRCDNEFQHEILKVTEDWLSGHPQELLLGWEVQDGREVYVKDMEKGGMWSILVEEEKEVALEVEDEVWTTLLNDLLLDLF